MTFPIYISEGNYHSKQIAMKEISQTSTIDFDENTYIRNLQ